MPQKLLNFVLLLLLSLSLASKAFAQDWSEEAYISDPRANPYELSLEQFQIARKKGYEHALYYPVEDTGLLLPYAPIKRILEGQVANPLVKWVSKLLRVVSPFQSFDEMEEWLGLKKFPHVSNTQWPKDFPAQRISQQGHRMGLTLMETPSGTGFTLSCAQCHSDTVFGKRILGMSNRFPRANDFFHRGLKITPRISDRIFQWSTEATPEEVEMFRKVKETVKFIDAKKPVQLGLDTSLAQVALSLAKRNLDAYATKIDGRKRPDLLDYQVADSKPAVWWGLKYKNRWLSDGSVVSGNPIFTNIIWNEIGRGADLKVIENWLSKNEDVIKELTTAVFSSTPPPVTDFFPAHWIDLEEAKAGERLFNDHCSKCHGVYEKNWSLPESSQLSLAEQLKTFKVVYPHRTSVVDVGTDPLRHQGMESLTVLNDLEISKANGIWIEPQEGYVPPPLEGIWLRWPYFHNNSAPSLCAVLTRGSERPVRYWARPAEDPNSDFDFRCNGYPQRRPPQGTSREMLYDSRKPGLSRFGHDEGIFLENGKELLSPQEKLQLIQFLQTL
ncbi:MAG: hypothetical protein CL676_11840 [Bdellovibrionaceae bacterium]|nr:hypothetical protein [Pseudobdellovibrionaceae bacterium]